MVSSNEGSLPSPQSIRSDGSPAPPSADVVTPGKRKRDSHQAPDDGRDSNLEAKGADECDGHDRREKDEGDERSVRSRPNTAESRMGSTSIVDSPDDLAHIQPLICTHAAQMPTCHELVFERPCEWRKHMDRHERPHHCKEPMCADLKGFTYAGGLLRHEREVHRKAGGPRLIYCPVPHCKRHTDQPFTRRENLHEHLRRLHRIDKAQAVEMTARPSEHDDEDDEHGPSAQADRHGDDESSPVAGADGGRRQSLAASVVASPTPFTWASQDVPMSPPAEPRTTASEAVVAKSEDGPPKLASRFTAVNPPNRRPSDVGRAIAPASPGDQRSGGAAGRPQELGQRVLDLSDRQSRKIADLEARLDRLESAFRRTASPGSERG